jgi:hypothetical protein
MVNICQKALTMITMNVSESSTGLGSQCIHICIVEVENELYRLVFGYFVTLRLTRGPGRL